MVNLLKATGNLLIGVALIAIGVAALILSIGYTSPAQAQYLPPHIACPPQQDGRWPDVAPCKDPFVEATPPEIGDRTCFDYRECRHVWVCQNPVDWPAPTVAWVTKNGECGFASTGDMFGENGLFSGWTYPVNYRRMIVEEVLLPCVEEIRRQEGVDEYVDVEWMLENAPHWRGTIDQIEAALRQFPETFHQGLLDGFRAECLSE